MENGSILKKKKKKKNVYNILFVVIEQLPFVYSFNTILHGELLKFLLSRFMSFVLCISK